MTSEASSNVHELLLSDIVINDKLQVRKRLNPAAITNYTNVYKAGGKMPPIKVGRIDGGALVLLDGWHRVTALRALGRHQVTAEVIETTAREAPWEAARANLLHGVPLQNGEQRNAFHAYVHARKHRGTKGRLKSYREIAQEIGGTRSYTTVRNWMIKDFPKIAAEMGGAEVAGPGGLNDAPSQHPEDELLEAGMRGAANAAAAARGIQDRERRGRLIEELENAVRIAKEAGPYDLANDDF